MMDIFTSGYIIIKMAFELIPYSGLILGMVALNFVDVNQQDQTTALNSQCCRRWLWSIYGQKQFVIC